MSAGAKPGVISNSPHWLVKPLHELLLQYPATVDPNQDLSQVVAGFCRGVRHLIGASGTYCWQLQSTEELVGIAADGVQATSFPGLRFSLEERSLAREAIEKSRAVFVNHIDSPSQYAQSILAVPLLAFGKPTGVLIITKDSRLRPFDLPTASAMVLAGSHLGAMLANAALLTQVRSEKRRTEALIQAADGLRAHQDAALVKKDICDRALKMLGAQTVALAWSRDEGFTLDAFAAQGKHKRQPALSNFASELAARAARAGEIVSSAAPATEALLEGEVVAAPIDNGAGTGALLVAAGSSGFLEQDRVLLSAFARIASTALTNAELHRASIVQSEDLRKLVDISGGLRRHTSIDRFMEEFVVRTAEFLGFRRASVALMEDGEPFVRWIAEEGVATPLHEPLRSALLRQVLAADDVFVSNDTATHPLATGVTPRQVLVAPLRTASGVTLGALNLFDRADKRPIGDVDVSRAKALAAEATVALEAAGNLDRLEEHRKRAEDLVELALALNSSLELPELARSFAARTAQMLDTPAAAVILSSANAHDTICLYPEVQNRPESLSHRLSVALADVLRVHGRSGIHGKVSELLGEPLGQALGWTDVQITPLVSGGGELLGILCLANRGKPLEPSEARLLRGVVSHAAVAIENSTLFSRIALSNRSWSDLFDAIGEMLIVHDGHNRIVRLNRAVEEAIGVAAGQLVNHDLRMLAPLVGENESACPLCSLANGGNAEYEHTEWQRTYLVSTSSSASAGDPQVVHVLKDITDRREVERLYRGLFDNIHEGVFFSTPEGRFVEVNDALVQMLGYESRDELLQMDIAKDLYLSAQDRKQFIQQVEEQGMVRRMEGVLRRKDGRLLHTLRNVFAVKDANGKTIQYRGMILDNTAVWTSQKALQQERDFNLKILNNTQTLIVVADTAGLISYANERCLTACGRQTSSMVGRPLVELFAERWRAPAAAALLATAEGEQAETFEAIVLYEGGRSVQHSVSMSPMVDEYGNITSIIVMMTDVTDAAMLQAKLIHSEKMAAVGQLVSGVAHEVNNPLTAIMGFADLLSSSPDLPESTRKEIEIIFQEAQRTKQIVQNLLSFARQTPPHREAVDVNSILQRTLRLRQYDMTNHGVSVEEHYDEKTPLVFGDPQQLQQVFLNIINNAYDAVTGKTETPHLDISTRMKGKVVEVSVTDNGAGVTAPEHIFDPFFTTKDVGKGTGLGLSICYGIIREHGGEISCSSEGENQGATFLVRLPIYREPKHEGGTDSQ